MSSAISVLASQRAFFSVCALLFGVSTTVTILWCASMPTMCGMPMPGGWTLSMPWMRMPGQTRLDAAASFVGMWGVMMIAMMLPSLIPMLLRYRRAVGAADPMRLGWLTVLVGGAYFLVWAVFGMAVYLLGGGLAEVLMQQPTLAHAVPAVAGIVVISAGVLQFSSWKNRYLACCRRRPARDISLPANGSTAWHHGLRLGRHCCICCAGLTAVLLVVGVMDLRAMAIVAAAVSAERLAPAGEQVARVIGVAIVATGLFMITQAAAA